MPALCFAQTTNVTDGIVFNQKTLVRMAQVTVTNLRHSTAAVSNDQGVFSVKGTAGDTLLFLKTGFTDQKLVVGRQQSITVFLIPVMQLSEVIVKGTTRKQDQQEAMEMYRSKGVFYNGKPPLLAAIASPLTGLYEWFGKTPGRARRFNNFIQRENKQIEMNRRYSHELVKRITKLPDNEVEKMMNAYTPPYEELKKWNDYELIQFINRSFISYKDAKGLSPLPKLY